LPEVQIANLAAELELHILARLHLLRFAFKAGNRPTFMVHEHRLAGGLPGLGAVIAHLDLDSDVGRAFFCRDVFGIDVCALGLQVGVEREGGAANLDMDELGGVDW
jgi:hypothetical protein